MAQIPYRANLNTGHFPLLSQLHGRSIIVPSRDQAFQQQVIALRDEDDKDRGTPQIYYCHNVMPSAEGLQSIGYQQALAGIPGETDFLDIFVLRNQEEKTVLFSPANNNNYVFDGALGVWSAHNYLPEVTEDQLVTVAYINGHTYVFFEKGGCFEYNVDTHLFDTVTLIGLDVSLINGICASSGFLIAFDEFTIYRSQAVNILDFTPDPTVGSGSSIPEEIRGKIKVCLPIANGFIIYTTQNAVGASFSQNIRFPFIYREIKGSAGIFQVRHVAWQDNIGDHYAWTEAGLQRVNKSEAILIFPNITDFLTSKLFEEYNTTTDNFDVTKLTSMVRLRLAAVTKRYIVVSYGIDNPANHIYTYALIYDLAYKRLGKAKIDHVAVFEFQSPSSGNGIPWLDLPTFLSGTDSWNDFGSIAWEGIIDGTIIFDQPRQLLAFLQQDGTVELANFDSVSTNASGVLVLGKYQFVRERWISIHEINLENIEQIYNYTLKLLSTIDGKNKYSVSIPYLYKNDGTYRQYLSDVQGLNQSIIALGTFHFADIDIKLKIEGKI